MKKTFLAAALLLFPLAAVANDSVSIRVVADRVGDQVEATVLIDSDEFINLGVVILRYSPNVLQPLSIDSSLSRFTFDAVEELDYARDKVRIIRGEPHGSVPKGDDLHFCIVRFKVIGSEGDDTVGVVFSGPGEDGDSAVYKDDGVPTDILTSVDPPAVVRPRRVSGRMGP